MNLSVTATRPRRGLVRKLARAALLALCLSASLAGCRTEYNADRAFDAGSNLQIDSLSPTQVDNLALLGQVWGFLKYHHPAVRTGQRQWDYDLLRQVPAMLAAPDRAAAAAAMVRWIDELGPTQPCSPCASDGGNDVHFRAALDWLNDGARLTPALSQRLQAIYRNRAGDGKQFYVSLSRGAANPAFDHEVPYDNIPRDDRGFRLLTVLRFWNAIEYWFPYRDVIGEDWHAVLADAIPRVVLASDDTAYRLAMMALVARINDTHAAFGNSLELRPPAGDCHLPAHLRFIAGRLTITLAAEGLPLRRGDELLAMDGKPVAQLVRDYAPYYAASNEPRRLNDIARWLGRGACAAAELRVGRAEGEQTVSIRRLPGFQVPRAPSRDRPGDTFQRLSEDVAYLKLSSVKAADLPGYVKAATGTRGLVVDIRNYPSEFVAYALGGLLVTQTTPFASVTAGDLNNPGLFRRGTQLSVAPLQPHYGGKVVILVDETSISQSEFTAMALRVAPGARVVGSTTAGADGNVSSIMLPGRLYANISGIGIFYPDHRPTQRVGIVPDIPASPSARGLAAGRDEVLEAGLRAILGDTVPAAQLEKMAQR